MRCQVSDCNGKVVSRGLCDKHRIRLRVHGHLDSTRPNDWGKRSNHPLYGTWKWITARTITGVLPVWEDFWQFVKDVGDRPSTKHTIRRLDESKPYGPDNFFWKERVASTASAKEYQRVYRKKNPLATKGADLKKHFGITIDDYFDMLDSQGGGCAICDGRENGRYEYMSVDHCHKTGRIRGLLCSNCNRGIGLLRDDPELLEKAAKYLR
jgi:hypothetical protein